MSAKQALVTGGTRGIGRAICLELAANGFDVAFTYRSSQEHAQSLEKEIAAKGQKAKGYAVEMADLAQLQSTLDLIQKDFSNIEALVNNAGISIDGLSMRVKPEEFQQLFDTNVRAAYFVTQSLMRPMMKARKGSIVFISSVIGEMGNPGQSVYAGTKAALFGFTKSLSKELGSRGIRVNAVTPGFIATDMTDRLPQQTKDAILAQIPLGSFGEAADVAKTVAFLTSSASKYITGQIIAVNGGLYV